MSKKRRQERSSSKSSPLQQWSYQLLAVILIAIGLAICIWAFRGSSESPKHRNVDVVAEPPMSADESMAWGRANIQPILDRARHDQTPEVRKIIQGMFTMLETGKAGLACPPLSRGDTIAFTDWDKEHGTPTIVYPIPIVRALKETSDYQSFSDEVILVTCHETLHLWYNPELFKLNRGDVPDEKMYQLYVQGETSVWAETVTRVVRPMLRDGRYVDITARQADEAYAAAGNNADDPKWKTYVRTKLTVPKEKYFSR